MDDCGGSDVLGVDIQEGDVYEGGECVCLDRSCGGVCDGGC